MSFIYEHIIPDPTRRILTSEERAICFREIKSRRFRNTPKDLTIVTTLINVKLRRKIDNLK
jgi:hypothetical protein